MKNPENKKELFNVNKEIWVPGVLLSSVAMYATYLLMDTSRIDWYVSFLAFVYPFFALFFIDSLGAFVNQISTELASSSLHAFLFGAGVIVEAFILINERHKITKKDIETIALFIIAFVAGVSLAGWLGSEGSAIQEAFDSSPVFTVVGMLVLGSVVFYPIYFREKILTAVDESVTLLWTLLLWYVYIELVSLHNAITISLIVVSLAVLYVNYTKGKIDKLASILMYLWYLICVATVSALVFFAGNDFSEGLTPLLSFVLGVLTLFFATHVMQILHFHPYFNMEDRTKGLRKSLEEHTKAICSKYMHRDVNPYATTGIIAIFVIVTYLNLKFDVIPLLFVVLSMVTFAPYLFDRDRWFDWKLPFVNEKP